MNQTAWQKLKNDPERYAKHRARVNAYVAKRMKDPKYKSKASKQASEAAKRLRSSPIHKNLKAILEHFDVDPNTGRSSVEFYVNKKTGYKHTTWMGKTYYLHALVIMAATNRFIPKNKEVNHKDLDKLNNRYDNLELVTRKQNIDHAIEKLGSFRPKVLTDEQRKANARANTRRWEASLSPKKLKAHKEKQRQAALRYYHNHREEILQRKADAKPKH